MMSVTVSIDGVQELHDMYRLDEHGNGSFAKAWKAFQDSKKYGWNGSTKMTFVPGSFKYIADSIIMMLNEGCDSRPFVANEILVNGARGMRQHCL